MFKKPSLIFLVVLLLVSGCKPEYEQDEGVEQSGNVLNAEMFDPKPGSQAAGFIDGEFVPIHSWRVSYIDKKGLMGYCIYHTKYGEYARIGDDVTCDKQELKFNK